MAKPKYLFSTVGRGGPLEKAGHQPGAIVGVKDDATLKRLQDEAKKAGVKGLTKRV